MKLNNTLSRYSRLLGKLGMKKNACKIYLVLLESGRESIAGIARAAGIDRPLVYRALPQLLELGLIGTAKEGKRTFYTALSPDRLDDLWRDTQDEYREAIPLLRSLYETADDRPHVMTLKGRKGIVAVYDDILNTLPTGGVFYRYSSRAAPRRENFYIPRDYRARRDAKRLERFVITSKLNAAKKKQRLEKAVKTIPEGSDLFDYNITQLIYGEKIAFVDYNTETAIIIDSPLIAKFQERIFRLLYQRL